MIAQQRWPSQARWRVVTVGLLVSLAAGLVGCAAPPSDRVILLPGSEGRATGGVSVKTSRGEQLLDKPLAQAVVRTDGVVETGTATAESVRAEFAELLAQIPPLPRTWTVYFETGSDRLVAQSEPILAEVREALNSTPAPELVLTGHTDRVGSVPDNDRLSLQRAQALKTLLVSMGFDGARIQVAGRGERQPLVPTADEAAEPRNRRVEIKLR